MKSMIDKNQKETTGAEFRTGYISLIGRPNVGKSTLMNRMIGQKIAITSNRPQTTRKKIQTVYTDDLCQMIFLDTPGIHETKNRLGEYMLRVAKSTLKEADVILWLVEPATFVGAGEQYIMEQLVEVHRPVILVINKSDTVEKEKLEAVIARYQECADQAGLKLEGIHVVSALKGQKVEDLMDRIRGLLPVGPPFYDEETVTNETMREIAAEIIREKALRLLREEVPHGIAVTIEQMKDRETQDGRVICDIHATILCEKDSHRGIVIGRNGSMLKKIGTQSRIDIEKMMECSVNLQLWVKIRKDWRDDSTQMKSLGFDPKKI